MNVLRLHPANGDPPISIEHARVLVGRDPGSDVHLKDASVSRRHAEITLRGEEWVIVDQKSGNGIHVDGRRSQEAVLLPGQQLQIGNVKFRVEIDRGDDGSTVMLGRSPLLEDPGDRTLMGAAPPVFPAPLPSEAPPGSRKLAWMAGVFVIVAVVIGLAFAAVNRLSNQRLEEQRRLAAALATPRPTPRPSATPTPEPTPTPTPVPVRRPTGSLLVSTDVDASVSIDGRVVAQLKASGLRRFDVAPGEHIVRFLAGDKQTDVVARVRVNEQTVVRHQAEPAPPPPPPSPTATPPPR
ncbi:MAG: FHA domain-containing protein [Vicinamibacteria bacterium]|nr:FHA domain-containing protein [Vicinamibacteria bacterium]